MLIRAHVILLEGMQWLVRGASESSLIIMPLVAETQFADLCFHYLAQGYAMVCANFEAHGRCAASTSFLCIMQLVGEMQLACVCSRHALSSICRDLRGIQYHGSCASTYSPIIMQLVGEMQFEFAYVCSHHSSREDAVACQMCFAAGCRNVVCSTVCSSSF